MLIKQIMDDDTSNCQQALEEDAKLKNLEEKLYTILSNCPEDTFLDLEKYTVKKEKELQVISFCFCLMYMT